MVFHTVPKIVQQFFPDRVWEMEQDLDSVYLTFDDGPVPGVTDFVLEELSKRNMNATFFMVGDNVRKYSHLARTVLSQGNTIGNHTFHHLNGWRTTKQAYHNDFLECDEIINDVLGVQPKIFRPPYGLMTGAQAKEIRKTHQIIMWSMLSGDYDLGISPSKILRKSLAKTKAGAISLFHDQEKTRDVLPKILPTYLDAIQERGWKTAIF